MKKIIIIALFVLLLFQQTAFSSDNFIYSINVGKNVETNNVVLDIKSDYKSKIKYKLDESGRRYFDIKDASLKENFSILYNGANGVEGVIAQQIGNKVRIYVNAEDGQEVSVNFNNVESQGYPDKSAAYALLLFGAVMFGILNAFTRRNSKFKGKQAPVQNTNTKQVYKDLMEKKDKNIIPDKSKLTLNSLNKGPAYNYAHKTLYQNYQAARQQQMANSPYSNPIAQKNVQSINDYQSRNSRVAM